MNTLSSYLFTFELLLYGVLLLGVRNAWRAGGLPVIWQLSANVVSGRLLEWEE